MVAVLPRIGLQLHFDRSFSQGLWHGSGPHEAYPDRHASSIIAVHHAPLDALYTPYIVPGENGSRTNISWLQLIRSDGNRQRVKIRSSQPFNFSAQPFTTEDLINAVNNVSLEKFPRPFACVNIDPFLMGLGGDDSWTASVHDEYLLVPGIYSFDFSFSFS